jgi:uncharacterized protein
VLVTSYEIERRMPFFFRSSRATDQSDYDFAMRDVARATSAAPTYFEPCRIPIDRQERSLDARSDHRDLKHHGDYYALVDGGVFANNPGMCALVEARDLYPDADEFLVVSLGTGEFTRRIPYEDARGWGLALWAQPLLGVVFDGVSDTVSYQLKQLCESSDSTLNHYYRFQVRLDEGSDDMDDASRTNIRVLKLLAEDLIRERADDLDTLVKAL